LPQLVVVLLDRSGRQYVLAPGLIVRTACFELRQMMLSLTKARIWNYGPYRIPVPIHSFNRSATAEWSYA
jgi:hypothetical protein